MQKHTLGTGGLEVSALGLERMGMSFGYTSILKDCFYCSIGKSFV